MIDYKKLLEKLIDELSHHEGVDVYFDVEAVINRIDEISDAEKFFLVLVYKRVR